MKEDSIVSEQTKGTVQTVPLAYHEMCMERNRRNIRCLAISFVTAIAIIVFGFVYLWLQYDFVSTTEYSGVYNMTDSTGNVISSDITADDLPKILREISYGENTKNDEENP